METEHEDLLEALSEILGMEPAMLRRAVEAARARNDEAGLSALMMRAAGAKMTAGLTDDIRRTVRGEQAGAFSVAICMEWNALYEQALTAAETALAEERAKREEAERQRDAIYRNQSLSTHATLVQVGQQAGAMRTERDEARHLLASNEASRERAEKVVEAARVASDWGNGGVEHGARCAAYNGQIGGSPYICKCGMDMLRAALAAYEEGR